MLLTYQLDVGLRTVQPSGMYRKAGYWFVRLEYQHMYKVMADKVILTGQRATLNSHYAHWNECALAHGNHHKDHLTEAGLE